MKSELNGAVESLHPAACLADEELPKNAPIVRMKTAYANSLFEAGKFFAKPAQSKSNEKMKNESCDFLKCSFDM